MTLHYQNLWNQFRAELKNYFGSRTSSEWRKNLIFVTTDPLDTGKVRLRRPAELPEDWDPRKDKRFTMLEAAHHMIFVLEKGE